MWRRQLEWDSFRAPRREFPSQHGRLLHMGWVHRLAIQSKFSLEFNYDDMPWGHVPLISFQSRNNPIVDAGDADNDEFVEKPNTKNKQRLGEILLWFWGKTNLDCFGFGSSPIRNNYRHDRRAMQKRGGEIIWVRRGEYQKQCNQPASRSGFRILKSSPELQSCWFSVFCFDEANTILFVFC